jgi:hypothetical protein
MPPVPVRKSPLLYSMPEDFLWILKVKFPVCRREVLPDGILYASHESHYSVFKAARMYRMDRVKVATLITGEIDCADLRAKLEQNKDKPAIINVNIGELGLALSDTCCGLGGYECIALCF